MTTALLCVQCNRTRIHNPQPGGHVCTSCREVNRCRKSRASPFRTAMNSFRLQSALLSKPREPAEDEIIAAFKS